MIMEKISKKEWGDGRQDIKELLELMQESFEELVDDNFLNSHEQYELTEAGLTVHKILANWERNGKALKDEYFNVH